MLDTTSTFLAINAPISVEHIVLKALQAEPNRAQVLALCALAQTYTVFERYPEAEAMYQTAIHIAIYAVGPQDKLTLNVKRDLCNLESLKANGGLASAFRPCVTDTRSILGGPYRQFLTHEPPRDIADKVFEAFVERPTLEVARRLQALALTKYLPEGKLDEAEALILAALEVANNADADESVMGELFADFDKVVDQFKQRQPPEGD